MPGAQVQSLAGELTFYKQHGAVLEKNVNKI